MKTFAVLAILLAAGSCPADELVVAKPLTKEKEFTGGIEGPACDREGNVYAVNYAREGTIGKVTPDGKGEVWVTLPGKSVGNGIVFDEKGIMFVADYVGHNILRIDPRTKKISVEAHEPRMNQPNDLAYAPDGTIWASDPNWGKGTGQVWRIGANGKVTLAAGDMGTTNGIEVSPDAKTLYVNESVQRNVWAFPINADGTLGKKRLLKKFDDHGFDGMRCDVDGNLYITRYGKGTVAVLSPEGKVLREIDVLGKMPSNICFGGPDGKTVYVTEVEHTRLVQFRVDKPGLAWQRWQRAQPPAPPPPTVFRMAQQQDRYVRMQREISELFKKKDYAHAEKKCSEAVTLLPMVPLAYYDLACARARLGKTEPAFESLKEAVDRGYSDVKHMKADADLESLRKDPRFEQLAMKAEKGRLPELWPEKVEAATIKDGEIRAGEKNTAWDFRHQILRVTIGPGPPPKDVPIVKGRGKVGDLLREWRKEGTAAGHLGDFYDNHDGDHSNMHYADFPQLTRIEFDKEAMNARVHMGLQAHLFYNVVTLGNSSTAMTSGPFWRSQTRLAYTNPRLANLLYNQYTNNHLYLYPEHRDHDPGHNGKGDGYGDTYPTNTPFVITSQGSSGSDIVFMDAVAETMAAFRPEVKRWLVEQHTLMPAIQMIFRRSNKNVKSDEDYLTGKAHPTVFEGANVDAEAMVRRAHEMTLASLPPVVRLRVVEEDQPVSGRDFFGPGEQLFDTPAVIARIYRSTQKSRRIVVSAEGIHLGKTVPTYHWVVLRGDAKAITIKPLNKEGSVVEIRVPYFERGPIEPGSKMESCRVDIGVFVDNGRSYSAPGFVTFCTLDSEKRVYNAKGLIESVDYTTGNYADPLIEAKKDWRDEYHYDKADRPTGWTRRRGKDEQLFTADGFLVQRKDDKGRAKTAQTVVYTAKAGKDGAPILEQTLGEELLHYEYSSDEDRVGRVKSREPAKP